MPAVRFRVDGRLYKALEVPQHLLNAVTSRIKIMAGMDISERRLPQDGRVNVLLEGRKIDMRVSTFPTQRGEKTVIRVLDTKGISLKLEDLGFGEDILTTFRYNIHAPNGIILVTGPTGSGKSTTLYGALNEISSMENNVCTVEAHRIPPAADQSVSGPREDRADVLQLPAPFCGKTPTSSWSAKSATRKRPERRFRPP